MLETAWSWLHQWSLRLRINEQCQRYNQDYTRCLPGKDRAVDLHGAPIVVLAEQSCQATGPSNIERVFTDIQNHPMVPSPESQNSREAELGLPQFPLGPMNWSSTELWLSHWYGLWKAGCLGGSCKVAGVSAGLLAAETTCLLLSALSSLCPGGQARKVLGSVLSAPFNT